MPKRKSEAGLQNAVAILDASTIYGAGRHYFGKHEDEKWIYIKEFEENEDRLLFIDLLHNLLLYDRILLDNTSVTAVELLGELSEIIDEINAVAEFEHIELQAIAPGTLYSQIPMVVHSVCSIVSSIEANTASLQEFIQKVDIPWYYKTTSHFDYPKFLEIATSRTSLNEAMIPFAMFVYRGICYSGYSNHYKKINSVPTVYLASPGRMRALRPILSHDAMRKFEFPTSSYADLVDALDIPSSGYDFSDLGLNSAHVSSLGQILSKEVPRDALRRVYEIRDTVSGQRIRNQWAQRIWTGANSAAVGSTWSNVISGSTITGNVNMFIHARALGG